jgi:hypothetical protein
MTETPALNLLHQSAIAAELATFASTILNGTIHSETAFTRRDYIFFALADKNLVTFDANRPLATGGFADDAFVLVRTLAECTINGAFVGYSAPSGP